MNSLVRALTEEGRDAAVINVVNLGAFDTGELADTSFHTRGYYNENYCVGIIYTDSYYAIFVEYGTGVVGEGGRKHPLLPSGWKYDINKHGDDGWWYISDRDGKLHWTKGQESRPFMYETYKELMRIAGERLRSINI